MSEYIMGLGVSVKICRAYHKLVSIILNDRENIKGYLDCVEEIRQLIEDETETYDKLDVIELDKYFKRINEEDTSKFDDVKSRYYLKLKERIDLLDSDYYGEFPFTLNTAIFGKILLDALTDVEIQLLRDRDTNKEKGIKNAPVYDLYSFHNVYKYTLISSNDFLERLAVDNDFRLCSIPKVSFEKIKENFECDDSFYKNLNKTLYLMAIDTINTLINDTNTDIDISHLYSNLLFISQLKVICSYLGDSTYQRLVDYCDSINLKERSNGRYITRALTKKRVK